MYQIISFFAVSVLVTPYPTVQCTCMIIGVGNDFVYSLISRSDPFPSFVVDSCHVDLLYSLEYKKKRVLLKSV